MSQNKKVKRQRPKKMKTMRGVKRHLSFKKNSQILLQVDFGSATIALYTPTSRVMFTK